MKIKLNLRRTASVAIAASTMTIMTNAMPADDAQSSQANPFFSEYDTPYSSIPFSRVHTPAIREAILRGIEIAEREVDSIANNPAPATFENTIVALENSGKDLNRVLLTAYPLMSANADDSLLELDTEASAWLSKHASNINLNRPLWLRIKAVYDQRDKLNLDTELDMLLTRTYEGFARSGATLEGEAREQYRSLSQKLAELTTRFGQNVLKELNGITIPLTKEEVAGIPATVLEEAAALAGQKGDAAPYLFTLAQPTYMAVMKYADSPEVRERFYRRYNSRNIKGEYSNIEIIKEISATRLAIANLLGQPTYADFALQRTMAETTGAVNDLLNRLADAYRPAQLREFAEIEQFASEATGKPFKLQAWDYSYWANKLKEARYSYDEEQLRPYFELNNVIDGVFGLATKLYGLTFTYNPDIEVYHPDVRAYEVKDGDGTMLGLLYTDFFPRESKRPGAWMTNFREESRDADGNRIMPHVTIVMNFTKPTASKPSLLTPYEVETFLHEFGHSLHGLLAQGRYESLSGTNVYRDFVELPSQFNENYLTQKAFLDSFAKHYQTGEPIPQEFVDKIISTSRFGAGYSCLRQLAFGMNDMAWHTITAPVEDAVEFENRAISKVNMFPEVEGCVFSPQFSHIFAGGYAAGYYSYKWAEVLDADAFAMFEKNGIFDPATAASFRHNILERGGSEHPMTLYKRFRGQEPTIDALLRRDGIIPEASTPELPQPIPGDVEK